MVLLGYLVELHQIPCLFSVLYLLLLVTMPDYHAVSYECYCYHAYILPYCYCYHYDVYDLPCLHLPSIYDIINTCIYTTIMMPMLWDAYIVTQLSDTGCLCCLIGRPLIQCLDMTNKPTYCLVKANHLPLPSFAVVSADHVYPFIHQSLYPTCTTTNIHTFSHHATFSHIW